MSIPSFLFGGDTNVSYSELQQRRKVLDAMMARQAGQAPQNIGEGLNALGQGILNGIEGRQLRNAQEKSDAAAKLDYSTALGAFSAPYTTASPTAPGAGQSYTPAASAAPMPGATTGGAGVASDLPGGEIYSGFIDTVRSGDPSKNLPGITNPYGLAAVAATGKRESGFSPGNVYRQWSDPSQSGQAGNAGGIMSWRAERLDRMRSFVAQNGGDPKRPSPQLQAQFFLAEDPNLVQQLNNAKSPEEAQTLMNNAWRFAGYDDPNNAERNARIATARSYVGQFEGQPPAQQPVQVASLDASAGMVQPEPAGGRGAVAAAMPAPTAPTPSPAVQRVAQAMPQPPNLQVDPRIAQALQNPALPEGQRRVLGAMLEQQQAQAQARYEADLRAWQTQEDRAYQAGVRAEERAADATVRQEGYGREDARNATLDERDGRDFAYKVEQGAKPPTSVQEYEYARANGFTGSFADWEQTNRKAGATTVNVGEGDKFYENLDRKNAERFASLSDGGQNARGRQAQVNQLDALLQQSPSGSEAAIKTWLGDFGIATDGLDALQASVALIEKMVPEQREPGSGPMSDADIAGFRRSLPRTINQPGGNQLIIGRLRAINEYDIARGEIADMVADRAITPAEGRKRLRELANPLDGYTDEVRKLGGQEAPRVSGAPQTRMVDGVPVGAASIPSAATAGQGQQSQGIRRYNPQTKRFE